MMKFFIAISEISEFCMRHRDWYFINNQSSCKAFMRNIQ